MIYNGFFNYLRNILSLYTRIKVNIHRKIVEIISPFPLEHLDMAREDSRLTLGEALGLVITPQIGKT